jgi:hypothetical protein
MWINIYLIAAIATYTASAVPVQHQRQSGAHPDNWSNIRLADLVKRLQHNGRFNLVSRQNHADSL